MDPHALMPKPVAIQPRLRARRITAGPSEGALVAWCPYCEGLHHHGGQPGGRARHCGPETGMPFSSYELTDGGTANEPDDALPRGMFVGTGFTLRGACERRGAEVRRTLARILLGLREPHGKALGRTGRRGAIEVTIEDRTGCGSAHQALPADDWTLTAPNGRERCGRGLVDLATMLFGVSPAVLALRALETVLGLRLDAEAAIGVCSVIAAWDARGRPGPQDGPHPHRT